MRVEAAYLTEKTSSALPIVVVMLKHQETCWRAHRLKIIAGFILSLLVMQYFFGASVYNFSLFDRNQNYFYHLSGSGWKNTTHEPHIPAGQTPAGPIQKEPPDPVSNDSNSSSTSVKVALVPAPTTLPPPVINMTMPLTTPPAKVSNSTGLSLMSGQSGDLPVCPVVPPVLVGPIRVWFDYPSFEELEKLYPYLEAGGHGKPKDCVSRHRVAIIIPYRDREKHLRGFLHNMHSLLTKQQLDYAIIIVDQIPNQTFNRAKLMNVGFVEALKLYDFQCFVFHDVDLFPQDDRNIYSCPEQPRHMSVAVDKFKYRLPYTDIFGGITALTKEQFQRVNGFSNVYWGWGGEDDDMATRYPGNIAKYMMVKHTGDKENPANKCRFKLLYKAKQRWKEDGLSNLKYTIQKLELNPLYTRFLVDLKESEGREDLKKLKIC